MLDHVRFHRVVLPFLEAFGLRVVPLGVRPDPRYEGNALRVRKPLDAGDTGRQFRDAARFTAVGRNQVELRLLVLVPLGHEGDRAAVGRPARFAVLFTGGGERARLAAESRKQPQARTTLVGLHVVRGDAHAYLRAVGG